jgi:hypothetical protein
LPTLIWEIPAEFQPTKVTATFYLRRKVIGDDEDFFHFSG